MTSVPLRIYVVDDDESGRMALGRLLRSAGFQVKIFASAQEFLDHGPVEEADNPGCADAGSQWIGAAKEIGD